MDRKIPNIKADTKPCTLNPSTIFPVSINIHALITRINNPSVNTVNGIVRTTITGLISVFTSARTIATPSAVK